ncbi:MAG: LapA family protein [Candidatus Krumholzibacteria bacterium]|nr:LapA family protein [Candidatus Krumholzibacteria bacterium]
MWIIRGIILLFGVVGLVWLGTLNAGTKVTFRFFNWTYFNLQLNVILVVTFIAGMLVWAVGAWIREAQLLLRVGREKKVCRRLQDELEALRNLPLDEEPVEGLPEDMP